LFGKGTSFATGKLNHGSQLGRLVHRSTSNFFISGSPDGEGLLKRKKTGGKKGKVSKPLTRRRGNETIHANKKKVRGGGPIRGGNEINVENS